jgi:hypothetical protein
LALMAVIWALFSHLHLKKSTNKLRLLNRKLIPKDFHNSNNNLSNLEANSNSGNLSLCPKRLWSKDKKLQLLIGPIMVLSR